MDTYGESRDIGYQDNPSVVGSLFPFQDEPEHQSCQETGEGIDLSLYSREPKGIAKGVSQGAYHATALNGDDTGEG